MCKVVMALSPSPNHVKRKQTGEKHFSVTGALKRSSGTPDKG
jgi:hypothetical protein